MDSALNLAPLDLPAEPSWWPLPISAWVVLGGLVLIVLLRLGYRHYQTRLKRKALGHLSRLESQPDLPALDCLLRRIALTYFPRNQVAGLSGEAWLAWLDKQLDGQLDGQLDSLPFMALKEGWLSGLYGNQPLKQDQWQACIAASRHWILHFKTEDKC
ncbi:DUF4381 domain-containing protein [Photobacterium gaetbulicola]|uniref:DUF4381 domain-containing protein n=1 Tax=Photobacterium gaetbulicola TaxID=1295392 RepID=UPI0006892594|nr:DUF4381 domain-containing protein [Photobacterium gaetbulicola]